MKIMYTLEVIKIIKTNNKKTNKHYIKFKYIIHSKYKYIILIKLRFLYLFLNYKVILKYMFLLLFGYNYNSK